MGNPQTVNRIFIVKAGMTPQDVINSKEATAQQKKMAYVFDSDGVAGYSKREADVFNATLITDRGQNGVSLWTRYKDGSKKETRYVGDVTSFKYAPTGEVKPYVVAKKQTPTTKTKSLATQIIQEFERTGKGELKVETYDNGNIKSKIYKNKENEVTQIYYVNGNLSMSEVRKNSKYEHRWITTEYNTYYENGNLKSSKTKELYPVGSGTEKTQLYYENGKPKSSEVRAYNEYARKWITTENNTYYTNGNLESSKTKELYPDDHGTEKTQLYYENGKPKSSEVRAYNEYARKWITTENNTYYTNGNLESSKTKELYPDDHGTEKTQLYYENGKPKLKVIRTGKKYVGMVETTHIEYDSNGNVIKNAKVTK